MIMESITVPWTLPFHTDLQCTVQTLIFVRFKFLFMNWQATIHEFMAKSLSFFKNPVLYLMRDINFSLGLWLGINPNI